ncbi:hypothetical protein PLESTM_001710000 [Pleodorina starrii]|nr:hypothetical protein PLESTM_001710000 [Pleodorina starrii]
MAEAATKSKTTPVADDWNWTARIRNELGANKAWHRNWGFLLDQKFQPGGLRQQQHPGGAQAAPAADSLAAFMQNTAAQGGAASLDSVSYIASMQRNSARARRLQHQDALDGFVSNYMARADPRARELPAQEFRKPLTTSHQYGWGRSLEVFGNMAVNLK